jgi:hypothetical protein
MLKPLVASTVLVLISMLGFCQSPSESPPQQSGNLEMRIEPHDFVSSIPQVFFFYLVNTSSHDLRIPRPAIGCPGGRDGVLLLKTLPLANHKCPTGNITLPTPILIRAMNWKLLHPGESLDLAIVISQWDSIKRFQQVPGTYEFWAEYTPPSFSASDREALDAAGIDYPRIKASSAHVTFNKKH